MIKRTFKDFLQQDISNVFFNVNEFAEEHDIDGETLLVIIDNQHSNDNLNGFTREQLYAAQEVFRQTKTIYVKSTDFYVPKVGSIIMLDGEEFYVEEADDEKGVIRMVISANES